MPRPGEAGGPPLAPRRSLAGAFWLWYVAGGGALLFLPLVMRAAGIDAPPAFFEVWIVAAPSYLLLAGGLVWVRGRAAHPAARTASRVLVVLVLLAIAALILTPHA